MFFNVKIFLWIIIAHIHRKTLNVQFFPWKWEIFGWCHQQFPAKWNRSKKLSSLWLSCMIHLLAFSRCFCRYQKWQNKYYQVNLTGAIISSASTLLYWFLQPSKNYNRQRKKIAENKFKSQLEWLVEMLTMTVIHIFSNGRN